MIKHKSGFTIVELIIIIVVIGILASVAIVGYGGWRSQTTSNVLKSDLQSAASAMETSRNWSETGYPTAVPSSFTASDNTEISVGALSDSLRYCLTSRSTSDTSLVFSMSSTDKTPREGDCTPQVTTFAGSGTATYVNGVGQSASFQGPSGLLFRPDGTLLVMELSGSRLRTITPDATVGLYTGTGSAGYVNGQVPAARFNTPNNAAQDSEGNIYVTDGNNDRIRKITPDGTVSLYAGSGVAGYIDSTNPLSAQFNNPHGIAVGKDGSVYISEVDNHCIRKIAPNGGAVTTFAGRCLVGGGSFADGSSSDARFFGPYNLAIDQEGFLYAADYGNHRVRKISPLGTVTTLAGSVRGTQDGVGTDGLLRGPIGLTIDETGTLYVSERQNHMIRRISPSGVVTTVAGVYTAEGSFADGPGPSAEFKYPRGIAIDKNGTLYVADHDNRRIRKIVF